MGALLSDEQPPEARTGVLATAAAAHHSPLALALALLSATTGL